MLSVEELNAVLPAETSSYPSPAQIVSSDEYMPSPQTAKQREYEHRIKEFGARMAKRLGTDRRIFFKSAAGMAASFLAMNDTWGPVFGVSKAEAQTPELANARAAGLKGQFIINMHTHFLREDTRIMTFVNQRAAVGKSGWNPMLVGKEQTIDNLKFANSSKRFTWTATPRSCAFPVRQLHAAAARPTSRRPVCLDENRIRPGWRGPHQHALRLRQRRAARGLIFTNSAPPNLRHQRGVSQSRPIAGRR